MWILYRGVNGHRRALDSYRVDAVEVQGENEDYRVLCLRDANTRDAKGTIIFKSNCVDECNVVMQEVTQKIAGDEWNSDADSTFDLEAWSESCLTDIVEGR